MKRSLKMWIGCLCLVIIDQLSKIWVLHSLKGKESIPLIPNVFELLYVENRGAAFGILQNKQWIFLLIAIVVLIALFWLLPRIPAEKHFTGLRWCLCFIGSGALGNMIDRIIRGYVVDFFYFKYIDFPVFNVADIYVTTAAIILIILVIFVYKEEDFEKIFSKRV